MSRIDIIMEEVSQNICTSDKEIAKRTDTAFELGDKWKWIMDILPEASLSLKMNYYESILYLHSFQ